MKVDIFLDPAHAEAGALQADLAGELNAIQTTGITITSKTSPPPPGTLGLAEAYQFLVDNHGDVVQAAVLLRALLDVINAVLRRRNIPPIVKTEKSKGRSKKSKAKSKQSKSPPVVLIVVGDAQLEIPYTARKESAFIAKVTSTRPIPRKAPSRTKRK